MDPAASGRIGHSFVKMAAHRGGFESKISDRSVDAINWGGFNGLTGTGSKVIIGLL